MFDRNLTSSIARKRLSSARHALSKTACMALVLAAAQSAGILTAQPVAAQSIDSALYVGGKARVNRSASLRSLSEAVASASCRVNSGIGTNTATIDLATVNEDFDRIIDGLVNGNAALGMPGPEESGRTRRTLEETAALWAPLQDAAARLASGSGTAADAATIHTGFRDLFDQTEILAAAISGQYSDPQQLLQSDATVLNFAVRQRALAYRMTRTMCELATGTETEQTTEELANSAKLFEQTLIALRDGFPAAGINPPPNDAVLNSLQATFDIWRDQKGVLDAALAGQTPTAEAVVATADMADALSVSMNNTITLYLIATPGQDGVYRVPLEAYARNELTKWLSNPALIEAIKLQNAEHADLTEDAIIALDQKWRAEAGNNGGPLIDKLLSAPVSNWLLEQQQETAGFVTEVFVMDNKGLNVAQSVQTSDYWQSDEAKWQQTYAVGPDALHISEVEFDDSTGFYQAQGSLSIADPETGEAIGAVTFGINVQSLL